MRATDPLTALVRFGQVPLFLIAVFLVWSWIRKSNVQGDFTDAKCLKMLQVVDRRLRKLQLVRDPNETLHQFADRIEQHAKADDLSLSRVNIHCYANWYRMFAEARYRGQIPQPFSDDSLAAV